MAEKRLFHPPDNSEMDAFALEHGKAIWLENTAFGFHILVSTEEEMRDAQRQGWRVKGNINLSDFGSEWVS